MPGVTPGALPPRLDAGTVCDRGRSKALIFLIIPFGGNMGAERFEAVLPANPLPHTVRAISDAAATRADVHLPTVPLVAFPPDAALALCRYIVRGKSPVFLGVPFPGQLRKKAGQGVFLARKAPAAIGTGGVPDLIGYFSLPRMPLAAHPPDCPGGMRRNLPGR